MRTEHGDAESTGMPKALDLYNFTWIVDHWNLATWRRRSTMSTIYERLRGPQGLTEWDGTMVIVTAGNWLGQRGRVIQVQHDASGREPMLFVKVAMDGSGDEVVFAPSYLRIISPSKPHLRFHDQRAELGQLAPRRPFRLDRLARLGRRLLDPDQSHDRLLETERHSPQVISSSTRAAIYGRSRALAQLPSLDDAESCTIT